MTLFRYNHTLLRFLDQSVDLAAIKVMLLNQDADFDATDTTVSSVSGAGAHEVSGFGWTAGGELITPIFTIILTDAVMVDFDNLSINAVGGNIGPAYHALVYSGTLPLFLETFAEPQTASDGTPMNVQFDSQGLFRVRDA